MNLERLSLIGLCTLSLVFVAAPQERQKAAAPADFPALLTQAGKAWDAKQYGGCLKTLRQASALVVIERVKAVRAALPNAPDGFEKTGQEENDQAAQNPFAAAIAAGYGSSIEQNYQEKNGNASIRVSITADNPMVQALGMLFSNPAMREAGTEVVKYGPHNALLKKQGDSWNLQILIGQDLCEVNVDGRKDDFLLAMFNQAAVDKIAAALAN